MCKKQESEIKANASCQCKKVMQLSPSQFLLVPSQVARFDPYQKTTLILTHQSRSHTRRVLAYIVLCEWIESEEVFKFTALLQCTITRDTKSRAKDYVPFLGLRKLCYMIHIIYSSVILRMLYYTRHTLLSHGQWPHEPDLQCECEFYCLNSICSS